MDIKTYQELTELIEGQRSIMNQQATVIKRLAQPKCRAGKYDY